MSLTDFLQFAQDNFNTLLGFITVISFAININQYLAKRKTRFWFESIHYSCHSTVRSQRDGGLSADTLIHTIYLVRSQAVAGLRATGAVQRYGAYDAPHGGIIFNWFRSVYYLLLTIRRKFPNLVRGVDDRPGYQNPQRNEENNE